MAVNEESKNGNLFHFLPVLQRLQVLHKNLGCPEVFLTEGAGGDGCSAGELEGGTPDQDWFVHLRHQERRLDSDSPYVPLCAGGPRCWW